jgi:hypothetical protein
MILFNQARVKGTDEKTRKEHITVNLYFGIFVLGLVFVLGVLFLLGSGKVDVEFWNSLKIIPIKH